MAAKRGPAHGANKAKETGDVFETLGIPDPRKLNRTPDEIVRDALKHGFDEFRKKLQAIQA